LDTRCGKHGTFDVDLNRCICDPASHAAGDMCDSCERGFDKIDGNCVRPAGCLPDSCGCTQFSTKSHCIAIGYCSSSPEGNGKVVCSCPHNFDGPRCDSCKAGFINYPECRSDCNPSCVHGTCDSVTKTCKCQPTFGGAGCDECAAGYSGDNCEVVASKEIFKIVGIVGGGALVLILIGLMAWFLKARYNMQQSIALSNEILMEGLGAQAETVDLSDQDTTSEDLDGPKSTGNNIQEENINLSSDESV